MKRIMNIDNFLKLNENFRKSREIDLQKLWSDFRKYKNQIPGLVNTEKWTVLQSYDEFINHVLNPIFKDKEIEFHRSINRFDGEITYGFAGRVSKIHMKTDDNKILVLVNLYEHKDTIIMTKLDFVGNYIINNNSLSTIIKVYDSDMTSMEIFLSTIENVNKYNL